MTDWRRTEHLGTSKMPLSFEEEIDDNVEEWREISE